MRPAYATKLGDTDAAELLTQTLEEEKEADETLNGIAEELTVDEPVETEQSVDGQDIRKEESPNPRIENPNPRLDRGYWPE